MSDLNNFLLGMDPKQQDNLLRKIKGLHEKKDSYNKLTSPRREISYYPLSFSQERQWFFAQLEPNNCLFNIPAVVRITGSFDLSLLEKCIQEVIQRHETLRTSFKMLKNNPVQVINPSVYTIHPIRQTVSKGSWDEIENFALQEIQKPFQLSDPSLLRVTVGQIGKYEHVLVIVMHHLISDSWSIGLFLKEIITLYKAFSMGETSPLSNLPIQYADFSSWQREYLQGKAKEDLIQYWKTQLLGAPALLELPTDGPRTGIQTYLGACQRYAIDKELIGGLEHLCSYNKVTLFMALLTALYILLYRITDQEDICIGSPIAGRIRKEFEELIGNFVNTLVLRAHISGDLTYLQLLFSIREMTLDAYSHQNLPFGQLVNELQPARTVAHQPFFNVSFIVENTPLPKFNFSGMHFEPLYPYRGVLPHDLILTVVPRDKFLFWEYNIELLNDLTIKNMQRYFESLLRAIVENPYEKISNLKIISGEMHSTLKETFNSDSEEDQ